mmetsp:Transcript_28972/g.61228  ORF Transcript_28972/g.61228 Transcript_28972/m.61228 type:complete len:103 (+) Transcript_28972:33-341(+)
MSESAGLVSLTDLLFVDTVKYCLQCRRDLRECTALRCSRCKVVHYCSRECQKSNFSLHKSCCKKISGLREQLNEHQDGPNNDQKKAREYDLAQTIVTCYAWV